MPKIITLGEDSDLGPEGLQVWVDDDYDEDKPHHKLAAKKAVASKPDAD